MTTALACFVFRHPLTVRFRDIDMLQHVNNATYFTYLEEARVAWLSSIPRSWTLGEAVPVLANVSMTYLRPITWPSTVVIDLGIEHVGPSSLKILHTIGIEEGDKLSVMAKGESTLVWVHPVKGVKAPLPESVRDAALLVCPTATDLTAR